MPMYRRLLALGEYGAQVSIGFDLLKAEMGDGYARSALVGSSAGLRSWTLKYDWLDNSPDDYLNDSPLLNWLWDFFVESKAAGDKSFILRCPKDGNTYLAAFADDSLSYELFALKLFSSGLKLQQRREKLFTLLHGGRHWFEAVSTPKGDTEPVAEWLDDRDNSLLPALPATQMSEAAQPLVESDGVPESLAFSGSQVLSVSSVNATQTGRTIFAVGRFSTFDGCLFEYGDSTNGGGVSLYTEAADKLVVRSKLADAPHYGVVSPYTLHQKQLFTIEATPTTLKLWINGTLVSNNVFASAALPAVSKLTLGAAGNEGSKLTGKLGLLAIMDKPSDANRQLLEAAIRAGYGL